MLRMDVKDGERELDAARSLRDALMPALRFA